jgi:hypothetical protein
MIRGRRIYTLYPSDDGDAHIPDARLVVVEALFRHDRSGAS